MAKSYIYLHILSFLSKAHSFLKEKLEGFILSA